MPCGRCSQAARAAGEDQRGLGEFQLARILQAQKKYKVVVQHGNGYPGWQPNVNSPLLAMCQRVYEQLFRAPPRVLRRWSEELGLEGLDEESLRGNRERLAGEQHRGLRGLGRHGRCHVAR